MSFRVSWRSYHKLLSVLRRAKFIYRQFFTPEIITVNSVRLRVASFPETLRDHIYLERYEREEALLIKETVSSTDKVLEIGGGAGYISTIAAKYCGVENVVVYEPNPTSLELMRETFVLNQVNPKVVPACVSSHAGTVRFYSTSVFWSSSTERRKGILKEISVPSVSFYDVTSKHNPSFLVIDAEGGEIHFIESVIPPSVRKILIEMHEHVVGPEGVKSVRGWLERSGFGIQRDGGGKGVSFYRRSGNDSSC